MKITKKLSSAFKNWWENMKEANPVTTHILTFVGMFIIMLVIITIANIPYLMIDNPQKAENASQVLGVIGAIGAVLGVYYLSSKK